MNNRVAVWLMFLSAFAVVASTPTTPCQAGPVLTTPTGLSAEEEFQILLVTNGALDLVASAPTTSIGGMWSGSLKNPIDAGGDGDEVRAGVDAYVWTGTNVSATEAVPLRGIGRPYDTTVGSDMYSSNYRVDATKQQSNAAKDRLYAISEVLNVSIEVRVPSTSVFPIICGSRGHFP